MAGGGGKGGSQTVETKIPAWLENAAKGNMARADEVSQIGYVPYYGPDIAALTPDQVAAQANNRGAAAAFGLDPGSAKGLPQAQTFANGVRGYSSAPGYNAALEELKARNPGQFDLMSGMFVNPVTGSRPRAPAPVVTAPARRQPTTGGYRNPMLGSDR